MKENLINMGGKLYKRLELVTLPNRDPKPFGVGISDYILDNQHLYIVSDEGIKEEDWFFFENKIEQLTKGYFVFNEARKIIATTNSKLNLPRPSNDFLKAYCKANGKIDEVYVEYIQEIEQYTDDVFPNRLKVAPDGTITVKKVELDIEEAAKEFFKKCEIDPLWQGGDVKELINIFKAGAEWYKNNMR